MSNKEAIEVLKDLWRYEHSEFSEKDIREALDMAIKALNIFEQAKDAGFRGEEIEFYIGGRKIAIRELAQ